MEPPYTPTHALAYCMGLIVGEGSFTSDGAVPHLAVRLHASDVQPLLDLRAVFGGVIYGPYEYGIRRCNVWMLRSWMLQDALPFLDQWLPPSRKREQYIAWRARWAEYFATLRPVSRRNTNANVSRFT